MAQDTEFEVSMQVGDLVEPTKRMQSFGYDTHGIIIGVRGGRFEIYFPALDYTAIFHPSHLKPDKK
tara:strand:- start:102 stop:299 length:198 start_codon:yes stop_codon:yes gene_type:complete